MKSTNLLWAMGMTATIFGASCSGENSTTSTTDSLNTGTTASMETTTTSGASGHMALSETDSYIDLKTGKSIRIRRDASSNRYTAEDMTPLDIYVNTTTRDTFWGPEGVRVNNALVHDDGGSWTVDEMRVERNGEGYKAKSEDGELKIKENENELKMKDGDAKVKVSDDEYKYKDGNGSKIKSNDKETKIKTPDSKTEIDHRTGEVKTSPR